MENNDRKNKSWTKKTIKDHNNRRSFTLTSLKRKNYNLHLEMDEYLKTAELTDVQHERALKLQKAVNSCSNMATYRENVQTGKTTLIGNLSCKNKLCFICNWARQKNIRRKYKAWFELNKQIVELSRTRKNKTEIRYTTQTQYKENKFKDWNFTNSLDYDLMHLTLTVPHYHESGFNGELYYFETISKLFKRLRHECEVWEWLVFGGEYGIETKKQDNGQHIHIHALLMVRRERQSRNKLHMAVLQDWNVKSINNNSTRETLTDETIDKILKSNKLIEKPFAEKLNPKGSTWIDLQNIYTYTKEGEKSRGAAWNSKEMIIAVMETISYHFEPFAFDKENKKIDVALLVELAPILHNQRLYSKFGCLTGETVLNVGENCDITKEFEEVVSQLVNEETGEISALNKFWLANPYYVSHPKEKAYNIELGTEAKTRGRVLEVETTKQALKKMNEIKKEMYQKHK
jgi:hypothetical protein